ncbi:zinc finger protein 595 [Culex quinquefasciatus]|uniref:Zinc finger protein 595 n=1 Tax=Culex quinquefasciatus TaxID=7176 RepID=B0WL22_CULQU|nr:zinc finger protein 595 [Culex quinquefasciatus]|eukprot:XP_001849406.1 zinc finger protein 595 [Culex quinquefasciatus]
MTTRQGVCAVPGCDASGRDFGTFLFPVPPGGSSQRTRWQEALASRPLTESDLVCWNHFELGAQISCNGADFRLADGAVPRLFVGGALVEGNVEQFCRLCARRFDGGEVGTDLAGMYSSEDSSLFLHFLLGDLEDSLCRLVCEECWGQVMCSMRLVRSCRRAARELGRIAGRTHGTEEVLLKPELQAEMDVFGEIPIDPEELEVKLEVESLESLSDRENDDGSAEEDSDALELVRHKIKHRGESSRKKKQTEDDSSGPFECSECPLIFERRKQLASHKKKHNGKVRKGRPPKNPDELYECEFCDFKCKLRQAMAGHRSSHSDQIRKTKPPEKIYDSVCPICGKVLATRGSFLTHMKIHNNQRDFSCDVCGKQFFKKKQRDMHVESFHEKKLFICKVCGVTCKWENSLERHMLKHEANSYKYECTQCEKKFLTAYLLKAHMTKHTGHQVFCEICGAGFRFNFLLTQHKIREHDIQVEGVKLYKRFQKGMRKGSNKRKSQQEAEVPATSQPEQPPMIPLLFQQTVSPAILPNVVGTGQQASNF